MLFLQADIYFSASQPKSSNASTQAAGSVGPASPVQERTSLYKISTISLMGQFLDPPLVRKSQLDVSALPNGKNTSDEELTVIGKPNDSSLESEDTINTDLLTNGTSSCPEARKVSHPVDPTGAVKYSGNLSWTTV